MQLRVSTDNHITGSDSLTSRVEAIGDEAFIRFGDQITRAEVHLHDESSAAKGGQADKRCLIEVRLVGMQPISASDRSNSLFEAISGAARKLESTLDGTLGKRSER